MNERWVSGFARFYLKLAAALTLRVTSMPPATQTSSTHLSFAILLLRLATRVASASRHD
jgi:hypothetical protein